MAEKINAASEVDIHDLSRRIHGWSEDGAQHWDELMVRYLRTEVVDPLADAIRELKIDVVLPLAGAIKELKEEIEQLRVAINTNLNPPPDDWLTIKEAADTLKIHRRTLMKLAGSGKIRSEKVGGQWRFKREWITEREVKVGNGCETGGAAGQ